MEFALKKIFAIHGPFCGRHPPYRVKAIEIMPFQKRRMVMKRISALALLSLASLLTAGSAVAADRAAKATIPFAFNVGDMVLPAGEYTISQAGQGPSGVIEIRSTDTRHHMMT